VLRIDRYIHTYISSRWILGVGTLGVVKGRLCAGFACCAGAIVAPCRLRASDEKWTS
jgi:hypothetical protein